MRKALWVCLFFLGLFWALASVPGLANRGQFDSIVLNFQDDIAQAQIDAEIEAIARQFNVSPQLNSQFSEAEDLYVFEGDRQLLKRLRQSESLRDVTESIAPNYLYQAQIAPNDPDYSKQWNLRSINIEVAWDDTKGNDVTVAVIDTGISRVTDLAQTQFVAGYDFVNDRDDATDDNGHGTHVAGTIAQSTNNNYGVAGIAYEANLMPIKVLSRTGQGTVTDIAEAIRFAADHDADVINMSLGGGGDSQVLREAIDYAYSKGVVIIAAAGNANANSASFPARYNHVIAVSAIDATGGKAPYSNYGAGVDISAPGGSTSNGNLAGGILQNTIDPQTGESVFRAFQGTSMASPHVAGVAALIKASGIEDPDVVAEILRKSARVIDGDELNHFGAGQLDAGSAVKLAQKGQINVRDFVRWLRKNGYLNLRFWFDGGAVALLPKVLMVLGAYLLSWILRNYLPFLWNGFFASGLVAGSAGLFVLKGLYIFDIPQFPFRVLGSSIPELGGAIQGSSVLNPIFASALIPFLLVVSLLGHSNWKWFAIGSAIGVASCLAVSAVVSPHVLWLGSVAIARIFLVTNAILCTGLAYFALKAEAEPA
ncbi:MAG: S8 family peptidase [Elainellaceae cyanobacterium]